MMGLAFFDDNVDADEKMQMVRNMRGEKEGSDDPPHRLDSHGNYEQKTLSNFVTINIIHSSQFLAYQSFLQTQPETWKEN